MSALQTHPLARSALAAGLVLGLGGCDEPPPPSPMSLIEAASNPDGDGQQARAAFTGGIFREQMHMFLGERLDDEQRTPERQP